MIVVDYFPASVCKNENVYSVCLKCGKCGRVFENGMLVESEKKGKTNGK